MRISLEQIIDCLFPYLQAWRSEGLSLTTTSNDAAKMFDATLTQVGVSSLTYFFGGGLQS